jgi:hypothetical protein
MKSNRTRFAFGFAAIAGALLIAVFILLLIEVVRITSLPPD